MSIIIITIVAAILTAGSIPTAQSQQCRCLASQDCWPSSQIWMEFNSSITGRLIRVFPPAAPCHDPMFDAQACQEARDRWTFPFWRGDQPGATQNTNWEMLGDEGCLISSSGNSTCFQGRVPIYAVNVSAPWQVQAAVRFASEHNLRLVIKNTGHDYLGRSSAPGSFSIWLHNLKNMSFHGNFVPDECPRNQAPVPAVTVAAGVQWEELYQATFDHNSVIVGGGCSSVGAAGGYPQAAGHGPLSPVFGLSADNILQYEVVTADGRLLVANRCQNQELFWALRGGGGGTYGVVVSATHRIHPALESLFSSAYTITASDRSSFEQLLTKFTELTPGLSDDGWSGYFTLSNQSLSIPFILANKNKSFAEQSLSPLLTYAQQHAGLFPNGTLLTFSSYLDWHLQSDCGGQPSCVNTNVTSLVGNPGFIASRLIPRKIIEDSPAEVAKTLIQLTDRLQLVAGGLVAGGEVARPQDNAVLPAWRRALWLQLSAVRWPEDASQAAIDRAGRELTAANKLLIDLTPGSGSYLNEADVNEPNWQQSFFGENYPRLYALKQKFDPAGLFVCHRCVGSEDWNEDLSCKK